MRPRSLVPALAIVGAGCGTDLVGPEDPEFGELCTVYVSEAYGATITREQLDRCEELLVIIVRFDSSEERLEIPAAEWDDVVSDLLDRVHHDREMEELDKALDLEPEPVSRFERDVLANCYQSRGGPMPKDRGPH